MSNPADDADSRPANSTRWFPIALAAVALGAMAIRIAYVLLSRQHIDFGGDARFYHLGANLLADGKGFIHPLLRGHVQAADHPPLYMVYLSLFSALGMRSTLWHLMWSCELGTATVVLVGLLGRRVGGAHAGIIAAVFAAAYPNMWIPDGGLLAETMAMFVTAAVLLLAYWFRDKPSWLRLAAVGAASGAAVLSRSELILFVPLLVLPLALLVRDTDWRARLKMLGAGTLAALIVMAPWVTFNLTRFHDPETLSTQFGPTLAAANCDSIYYGNFLSYYDFFCAQKISDRYIPKGLDESQQDAIYRREALKYISHHQDRLPAVIAARVGAVLGLYKPRMEINIDGIIEGRGRSPARWGLYSYYLLASLAIGGAVVLRRRRTAPLYPLLVPPVIVLVTIVTLYTSVRFRTPAEISIVVLAGIAADGLWNVIASRLRPATATPADS